VAQTKEGGLKLAAHAAGLTIARYQERIASGHHRCRRCKEWRPRNQFTKDATRINGVGKVCYPCRCRPNRDHWFKPGAPSLFKGRTHTPTARAALSRASKGNLRRLGKKHTPETRALIATITRERTARGAKHYAYRGGASSRNLSLRRQPEYFIWRKAVFARDGYKCRDCGDDHGSNLRAHHEKPVATHPELAYDVGNGVTLCHPCHELRHYKPDSIRNQRKLKRGERLWK